MRRKKMKREQNERNGGKREDFYSREKIWKMQKRTNEQIKISIKMVAHPPPSIIIIFLSPFISFRLSSLSNFFSLTMPSKMILLFVVPMFVGCCTILWIYWDRIKKPKKKIFISADCWLCVFDLLTPSQLGHGIAMISHRFGIYVDEHFKTRKWALKFIGIGSKSGENGTKEMEIVNYDDKPMPIPQIQMPRKVIGFERISISYIDQNTIAFLRHFLQLFAACPINLTIDTYYNDRILEFISRNIWPMIATNIHGMELSADVFHRLRKFVPSILNDCPSLRIFSISVADFFTEFPADDSAIASDGQAVTKWLFIPLQENDVPKVFKCALDTDDGNLMPNVEPIKAAFASASSPANFIVIIWFIQSPFAFSVLVPFDLTNELTREQLALKGTSNSRLFLLVRCPITRDESKWTKWEKEAIGWEIYDQWNQIDIHIYDDDKIGDVFDANPGPSDQQQK